MTQENALQSKSNKRSRRKVDSSSEDIGSAPVEEKEGVEESAHLQDFPVPQNGPWLNCKEKSLTNNTWLLKYSSNGEYSTFHSTNSKSRSQSLSGWFDNDTYSDRLRNKNNSQSTLSSVRDAITRIRKRMFRMSSFVCDCLNVCNPPEEGGYQFNDAIDRSDHITTVSWKLVTLLSIIVAIIAVVRVKPVYEYYEYRLPEWKWDRNVYISPSTGSVTPEDQERNNNDSSGGALATQRISLIAQVSEDQSMRQLSDVSSRPNRAYARQWKMDYAEYYAGRVSYSSKSCFDKVTVLQTLAEKQREEARESPPLWPHPPRVQYDSIVLLPSDAIVMNMDENIVDAMLPRDKLVAIAGWKNSQEKMISNSGVILFNLKHKHAWAVASLWWIMSQELYLTCGAGNGVSTLIDAIGSVMDETSGETLDDLIEPIFEHPNGALGNQMIKCLPTLVPGARNEFLLSNLQQSGEAIHQTADSVCYRFYPQCEVIP